MKPGFPRDFTPVSTQEKRTPLITEKMCKRAKHPQPLPARVIANGSTRKTPDYLSIIFWKQFNKYYLENP